MHAAFSIFGLVNPLSESPCFALPVFRDQDGLRIQVLCARGMITSFVPFSISEAAILKIESGLTRRVSEPGLHAFCFGPSDHFEGTKEQLASLLRERWNELEHRPFLRVEVADFLHDYALARQAVQEASLVLATVNKKAAQSWAAQVSRSRAAMARTFVADATLTAFWTEFGVWGGSQGRQFAPFNVEAIAYEFSADMACKPDIIDLRRAQSSEIKGRRALKYGQDEILIDRQIPVFRQIPFFAEAIGRGDEDPVAVLERLDELAFVASRTISFRFRTVSDVDAYVNN